jgi:hypothetical protein
MQISFSDVIKRQTFFFFLLRLGASASSNSAYHGYPEVWILRYPADTYHNMPSPGFKPMTLWLRVQRGSTFGHGTPLHIVDTGRLCRTEFSKCIDDKTDHNFLTAGNFFMKYSVLLL